MSTTPTPSAKKMKPRKYMIGDKSLYGTVVAMGMHMEGDRWYMAKDDTCTILVHEPSEV